MYDLDNVINSNGLNFENITYIISYFTEGLKSIYGENISVEQNSPDGQAINIISQAVEDLQQIASFIYNSFDVNASSGRILDRNVAYNGIKRQAGSYTIVPIEITFSQATTLQGLDDDYNNVNGSGFTVGDNNGNNFILITSTTEQQGTSTLYFRSQAIGEIQPILNTIKNIITPQLGVVSVNNPTAPQQIGQEEESDYNLLQRFKQTFSLGGLGGFNNIKAAILNLEGVLSVDGENNYTNFTSSQGTPPHSVWLIVQGGDEDEIAEAIFKTIGSGCGMKGEIAKTVMDIYNLPNLIYFDRPLTENYYLRFKITAKNGVDTYDADEIKNYLVNNYVLGLSDKAEATAIDIILNNGFNQFVYNEIEISKDNINWQPIISPTTKQYILTLSINNITIL